MAAVRAALDTGYRHIDTAAAYGNEREVGEAIRGSGLDRDEVFVETKVWISDYGYDATLHAFDKSAGKLGLDQLDLLILHQALPDEFKLTIAAYKALEKLLADGKVRAIGVSSFMLTTSNDSCRSAASSRPSTRSRSTPTSASRTSSPPTRHTASCPRRGPPSVASPSTATARTARPCRTPPSP